MRYRFLDKVAISDSAFEAFGKSEQELFENATLALFGVMANPKKVKKTKKMAFSVSGENLERLLYNFLSEIVFLKDTENMVFCLVEATVAEKKNGFTAKGILHGENVQKLNSKILRRDVKAITWHKFGIQKTRSGFKATVVVDI